MQNVYIETHCLHHIVEYTIFYLKYHNAGMLNRLKWQSRSIGHPGEIFCVIKVYQITCQDGMTTIIITLVFSDNNYYTIV